MTRIALHRGAISKVDGPQPELRPVPRHARRLYMPLRVY